MAIREPDRRAARDAAEPSAQGGPPAPPTGARAVRPREAMLFAGGSLSWAVSQWVLVWLIARFVGGAEPVGEYALALSIATPIYTLAQCGLRIVYLSLPHVLPWRWYVLLRIAGVVAALAVAAACFGLGTALRPELWGAVLLLKAADSYLDLLQARLQRAHRLVTAGLVSVVNNAVSLAAVALAIVVLDSLPAAILASALVSVVMCIVVDRLAARRAPAEVRVGGVGTILRAGIPTALSEGLQALASYLPILLLANLADASRVGVLTTASYLLTAANLTGSVTKGVFLSSFRETLALDGTTAVGRRATRLALRAGAVAAACVPVVVLLGDPVLRAIYGDEFGMSHAELALLALAAAPIVPSEAFATALSVANRFTSLAIMWAAAVAIGCALGLACVAAGVEPLSASLVAALGVGWCRLISTAALLRRVTAPVRP